MESGTERAFFKTENARGNLFDPESDGVAVHATLRSQGLQHRGAECSLQAIVAMLAHLPIASYRESIAHIHLTGQAGSRPSHYWIVNKGRRRGVLSALRSF